jgi:prepilin-type N-terminal cleavage/methylation domain-containing protein/prepilin-type processing-associated H-X9-DG protein
MVHASRTGRRAGFTLVELLVVIGIIALLISILLPSLSAARKSANSVKCLAALKEIGNAYQLYGFDFKQTWAPAVWEEGNENFPIGDGTGNDEQRRWADLIAPYISSVDIRTEDAAGNALDVTEQIAQIRENSVLWGCPEWQGIDDQSPNANDRRPGYGMVYYGPQWWAAGRQGLGIVETLRDNARNSQYYYITRSLNRGTFPKPTDANSEYPLIADSVTHVIGVPGYDQDWDYNWDWFPWATTGVEFLVDQSRHIEMDPGEKNDVFRRGTNSLYWDGHAARTSIGEMWESMTKKEIPPEGATAAGGTP